MLIGWLRPWQAEQSAPGTATVAAAKSSEAGMRQSVTARTEIAPAPEARAPGATAAAQSVPAAAPVPAPVHVPAPAPLKSQAPASASAQALGKPHDAVAAVSGKAAAVPEQLAGASAADSTPAQNIIPLADLPLALQQELPPMTITVHAYSARPGDRMVGINNRMLREGDNVVPGLKLEQITPEGMVFGYKGYNFRRGVK